MFLKLMLIVPLLVLLIYTVFNGEICLVPQFWTVDIPTFHLSVNFARKYFRLEQSTEYCTDSNSPVEVIEKCHQFGLMNRNVQFQVFIKLEEK